MKNENKCFFSISLENGITITGENEVQVKDFLLDLTLLCNDSTSHPYNLDKIGWRKYVRNLRKSFDDAWTTIYNNYKKN